MSVAIQGSSQSLLCHLSLQQLEDRKEIEDNGNVFNTRMGSTRHVSDCLVLYFFSKTKRVIRWNSVKLLVAVVEIMCVWICYNIVDLLNLDGYNKSAKTVSSTFWLLRILFAYIEVF